VIISTEVYSIISIHIKLCINLNSLLQLQVHDYNYRLATVKAQCVKFKLNNSRTELYSYIQNKTSILLAMVATLHGIIWFRCCTIITPDMTTNKSTS